MKLIVSKRGRGQSGYYLTAKGVAYVRKKSIIGKETVGDKLREIRRWIIENKDSEGLVDALELSQEIARMKLDPERIVKKLEEEGFIVKSPKVGKWLVVK